MTDLGWIDIPNWDKFQHYKERNPPWIKNHTDLLHREEYLQLTGDQRSILHGLWLEYASSSRRLRADTRSLTSRLRLRVTTAQLEALNHAGFIAFSASTPLANRVQRASTSRAREEAETEREEQNPEGSNVNQGFSDVKPLDHSEPTAHATNNGHNPDDDNLIDPTKIDYQPKEIPW